MKLNPRLFRLHSLLPSRMILLLFCPLLLLGFQLQAQESTQTISGKVSLSTGTADLSGTSVQMKGAGNGVTTDDKGHFKINVKRNAILVFSRVGFKSVEIKTGTQSTIDITLEPADNSLDQVVVVSYGKQKARNITGAIGKVNASEMQDLPAAEFGQKLNGKVAGLQINQVTGRPGQAMTFRLRGAASLGNNQPLFVVDGQPVADINNINPDEIESFSVLKDAAAAALYGSRSSNGVILITTRQAKAGRSSVSFNTYYGWQTVPQRGRPDLMNAKELATFLKGYYEDKIKYKDYDQTKPPPVIPDEYLNPDQYGKGTDWYDALLRTAPMQNYSLNVSSGTEKSSTSVTASYFNQQGVVLNTGMERFSIRANSEFKPFDKLKFGFNVAPTYQYNHNTSSNTDGNRQIIGMAQIASPIVQKQRADGTYPPKGTSAGMYNMANPYQQMKIMEQNEKIFRMLGNGYADLEIIDGLHARTSIGVDVGMLDQNYFRGSNYGGFGATPPNGNINAGHNGYNYYSWLSENLLTYNFKVNKHNFDLMGGYTYQYYERNFRNITGSNLPNDQIHVINVPGANIGGSTNNTDWSMISYIARLNYDFDNKYFLSANFRRDGSSRFAPKTKWGNFPAISAGWVISEENFFPKINAINFLKLRASYGKQGNNSFVNDYPFLSYLSSTPYVSESGVTLPGFSITSFGNNALSWETTNQMDFGFDANLLNNRLTFTYDYFTKTTSEMLYTVPIPFHSGFSSMTKNAGKFRVWGHEFSLTSRNLTGPLSWTTSLNFSLLDNKVLELVNDVPLGGSNKYNDYNRTAIGRRIGELWGYQFDGLYTAADMADPKVAKAQYSREGTAKMKNLNGDNVIDGNDRTYLGNPNVRYMFGITNELKYRNWDFSVVASGQGGNKIMDINKQNTQNIDGIFNMERGMMNVWRSPENPGDGKTPRTFSNTTELYRLANSNWVYRGDYLTIRNITLGYTFQSTRIRYLKSARLYASCNQAFVFTSYPGQNPEANDTRTSSLALGIDNGNFPVPRSFQIGANINF